MPLNIIFGQLPYSLAMDAAVRASLDAIERKHGKIVGCRVTFGAARGSVKIELTLPGITLCVDTSRVGRQVHSHTHAALRDAFKELAQLLSQHDEPHLTALRQWNCA